MERSIPSVKTPTSFTVNKNVRQEVMTVGQFEEYDIDSRTSRLIVAEPLTKLLSVLKSLRQSYKWDFWNGVCTGTQEDLHTVDQF